MTILRLYVFELELDDTLDVCSSIGRVENGALAERRIIIVFIVARNHLAGMEMTANKVEGYPLCHLVSQL